MNKTSTAVRMEMVEHEQPQPRQKEDTPSFSCATSNSLAYRQGDETLRVLNGIELALWSGQSVALVAPSGAGKSTLLHIAGLLEHPDRGDVYIDGQPTSILADHQRTRIRRNEIGFVYQSITCCRNFPLENVVLPQMIRGLARSEAKAGRPNCLTISVLAHGSTIGRQSYQEASSRVAIARAVANAPRILWRTSQPATSTFTPQASSTLCLNS